ncbi:chondroitin sulfate synthase 2 [Biomphalaria pfeifferi]|uniref:Hexosyltransferase n=1 Tax=Biomphalaria pfeifferi TaxID=112525 RepID=A0AAD8B1U7_BIOPF|nr:chondroitin sulfate synthase 2 [Biomphalaria pfeifferi]
MKFWRCRRFLLRCSFDFKCISRAFLPALVGLCLGMTISMMYAPFSEDSCETFIAKQDPQKMIKLRDTKSFDAQNDESYEPRVLEPPMDESKYKVDTKAGAKFFRPKFAATELGIREKLFVAVLSSKDTLNTLAVAVNRTVSHYVTKTVYFIDKKAAVVPGGMVIVNFDDGYNHLMPTNVFKFVIKKYGQDYDYFMFLSDKGYVRAEKVFDLVSHISVSKHVHLGTPKGVEGGKTYCSLEGGVIISQSLLSLVNSSLKWCSENCHSLDSSVNFGKCLLHATDLECHSTVANKVYTAYPVKNLNFNKDIEALREQANFNKSLSVFPMPDEITHYKMHRYFCEVELNSTRHQIQEMKDNILYMSQFAPGGRDSISWPIGVPEPYKPKNRFDVIRWDYFTETHIFFQDDFTNVKELIGIDKLDIQDIIKISMEKLNEQHNNKYLYSYLINGYRRFDPQRGMEYLLDLALEDTSIPPEENNKNNYNKRIIEKRVFLVRPLGEVEVVPMPYVTESTRLNIILSITPNEMDGWGVFLETYARLQAESADSLALIIVFVYPQVPKTGEEDVFSVLKSMVTYYDDKSEDGVKTRMINFANNGTYVPEFKIIDTVSDLLDPDALILTCTVGMLLNAEMLNRVRINTIPGWQVFFPIGFWQYKPNIIYDKKPYPTDIEFSSRTGHYDVLSYEHGSFYNSDYKDARRSFSIEELMKYDLYEMFVRYGKVHVFRAVEPEFKHYYMQLDCPVNIPSKLYERCLERKSMNLATRAQLAKRIFQYQAKREMQHSTQNVNKE